MTAPSVKACPLESRTRNILLGCEFRNQPLRDRQDVDQHHPECELHRAASLTAVAPPMNNGPPCQHRKKAGQRPKRLKEPLKELNHIHNRGARRGA